MTVTALSQTRVREPLYDQIYEVLQQAISVGTLETGALVREAHLVKLLGASRAPVRQALARLHDDGLLCKVVGVGHVVGDGSKPVSEIDLSEVLFGTGSEGRQIRKAPAWEHIYEQVERAIIHRSAFGSVRVNEQELARYYDVGRIVARDVLTRLEALGAVEKDAQQRWSVVPLDALRIQDLNQIRTYLEPAALRQSCHELRRGQLSEMRRRLQVQIESYPSATAEEMNILETDLHVTCIEGCGNKEMLNALRRTHPVLTLSKHILGVEMPLPEYDPFMVEHLAVLDALLDGDVPGAATALERHLCSATPKVIQRLGAFQSQFRPPEYSFFVSSAASRT